MVRETIRNREFRHLGRLTPPPPCSHGESATKKNSRMAFSDLPPFSSVSRQSTATALSPAVTLQLPAELQLEGEGRNLPPTEAPAADSPVMTSWATAFLTQTAKSFLPWLRLNLEEGDEDFVFVNLSLPSQPTAATPKRDLTNNYFHIPDGRRLLAVAATGKRRWR